MCRRFDRACSPQFGTIRALLALTAFVCTMTPPVHAELVTLRFEATVGPPRDGMMPIELPFSFAEGDRISGSFTFEPFDAPSNLSKTDTIQTFPFELQMDTVRLETATYRIEVVDNLVSDDGPLPEDRILLQCLGVGTSCIPMPIQGAPQIEWSFSWTLNGDNAVLSGADIPGHLEKWNQLSPSTILVSFQDRTSGRGTGFQVTIDALQVVPEPGTLSLVMVLFSIVLGFLKIQRRKQRSFN